MMQIRLTRGSVVAAEAAVAALETAAVCADARAGAAETVGAVRVTAGRASASTAVVVAALRPNLCRIVTLLLRWRCAYVCALDVPGTETVRTESWWVAAACGAPDRDDLCLKMPANQPSQALATQGRIRTKRK